MKLTKNTLIEGKVYEKGLSVVIKESKNFTKKQLELIAFINHQISIDISNFVDVGRSSTKYIMLYTDELEYNDLQHIESLGFSSKKFRIEPNGHKAVAIIGL